MATDKQVNYISILSDHESTKEQDEEDIQEFLEAAGENRVEDLSKREASELIEKLLERPVIYTFPCGSRKEIHKKEANRFDVLGELEACLHGCPKGKDPNECLDWRNYKTDFESAGGVEKW